MNWLTGFLTQSYLRTKRPGLHDSEVSRLSRLHYGAKANEGRQAQLSDAIFWYLRGDQKMAKESEQDVPIGARD
jgi:hypothetical protein